MVLLYQDKRTLDKMILKTNIYLIVFHFPFEASKGNKNASIFKVPANADPSLRSGRRPQIDLPLPLYTFCLLARPNSHGKTYKAGQTQT